MVLRSRSVEWKKLTFLSELSENDFRNEITSDNYENFGGNMPAKSHRLNSIKVTVSWIKISQVNAAEEVMKHQ